MREKLRTTTTATRVRGRAYDVVAHQQAAMPEQLPAATDPEHDDQEPDAGRREAIDLTALRALKKSRTDVEALDLTDERLRRLQDAFTKAADASRTRADRYAEQGRCRWSAAGAPGRPAGAPPAGARTAPRPGDRPLKRGGAWTADSMKGPRPGRHASTILAMRPL